MMRLKNNSSGKKLSTDSLMADLLMAQFNLEVNKARGLKTTYPVFFNDLSRKLYSKYGADLSWVETEILDRDGDIVKRKSTYIIRRGSRGRKFIVEAEEEVEYDPVKKTVYILSFKPLSVQIM